jgi:hypothetical protein
MRTLRIYFRALVSSLMLFTLTGCGSSIDLGKSFEGGNAADIASNTSSALTPLTTPSVSTQPGVIPVPTGPAYNFLAASTYEPGNDFESRYLFTNSAAGVGKVIEQKSNAVTNGWDAQPNSPISALLGSDGLWYQFNPRGSDGILRVLSPTEIGLAVASPSGTAIPGQAFKFTVQEIDIAGTSIANWVSNTYGTASSLTGSFPALSKVYTATRVNLSDLYLLQTADGPVQYAGTPSTSLSQTMAKCSVTCAIETYNGMKATYLPANAAGIGVVKLRDLATNVALADATWQRKQISVNSGTPVEAIYVTFPDSVVATNTLGDGKYKIYAVNPADGLVYHGWHYPAGLSAANNRLLNSAAFGAWWAALPNTSFALDFTAADLASVGAVGGNYALITGANSRPAAKFSGGDPIRIPNRTSVQFTNGATFDFWARMDSATGMDGYGNNPGQYFVMTLVGKSFDQVGFTFDAFSTDSNYPGTGYGFSAFRTYDPSYSDPSCNTYLKRNPGKALGQWYRVTGTLSSTAGIRVYADKELVFQCPAARVNFTTANLEDLFIGGSSSYFWYPLYGAIQDLRIYKSALNPAQVQALP